MSRSDRPGQGMRDSISELIMEIVADSPMNRLSLVDDGPIFEAPLVGFADGDAPLFDEYKHIIGDFHMTPREVLMASFGRTGNDDPQNMEHVTVVCWVLPFAKRVKTSNAKRESWPSMRWSHATRHGEKFNDALRQRVSSFLAHHGYLAVAPVLSSCWMRINHHPGGHTSNWSERHALYAAGMGTFGLSDGFITEKGMAMRCGSVVTNLHIAPTPRRYKSHTENCAFYANGSCGICIDRCPANAISRRGHDKIQCRKYRDEFFRHLSRDCGVEIEGCGLCQTGVPCESGVPVHVGEGR